MHACNSHIGTEPFEGAVLDKKVINGVALPVNKFTLYPLKVIFGNEKYPTGSTIYVAGEHRAAYWAMNIYSLVLDGKLVKFLAVPETATILAEGPGVDRA